MQQHMQERRESYRKRRGRPAHDDRLRLHVRVPTQAGPSGMRIADLLEDINAQSSVRVSERDVRLALNELVSTGLAWQRAGFWQLRARDEIATARRRISSALSPGQHASLAAHL